MARKRTKLLSHHVKFAKKVGYERSADFFEGKTAEQLVELGFAEIKSMGYNIWYRKLIKPTTTMPITLYLGANFRDYGPIDQAAVLWHEIVHALQWRDPKNVFPLRYINRRWQWAFETQGYRQQCRVYRALMGDKKAKEFARGVPERMMKKPYTMRRLDAANVRAHTLRAFEIGLPGLKLL